MNREGLRRVLEGQLMFDAVFFYGRILYNRKHQRFIFRKRLIIEIRQALWWDGDKIYISCQSPELDICQAFRKKNIGQVAVHEEY